MLPSSTFSDRQSRNRVHRVFDRPFLRLAASLLVISGAASIAVHADTPASSDPAAQPPDAPPAIIAGKRRVPELLLADKQGGTFFTGIPLIGYDDELGWSYGAAIEWYDNGPKKSPFFAYTPYRRMIKVGAAGTTENAVRLFVGYDQPYIKDTRWSVSGDLVYEKNDDENFFGVGQRSLERLRFPGLDQSFREFDDYEDARNLIVNGQTWRKYDSYRRKELTLVGSVEYGFLDGLLQPAAGFQISRIQAGDYTGQTIGGAIQQETRLHEEVRTAGVTGFKGGWNNLLSLGLTWDSRDFSPDPNSGVLAEIFIRASAKWLGSDFNYRQITTGITYFHDLLPRRTRLIFAGTLVYESQFGNAPFFAQSSLAVAGDEARQGLGGFNSLPGYLNNRFIGDTKTHANLELRWSFWQFVLWKQHIRTMLVPFVGAGRVFDSIEDTTLKGWKSVGGLGLRLAWNLSTVISFDNAFSSEGNVFYMELGHPF